MADKFKVGDVVTLRSGGPQMTVSKTHDILGELRGDIHCQWFGGRKLESGWFPTASLVHVENDADG